MEQHVKCKEETIQPKVSLLNVTIMTTKTKMSIIGAPGIITGITVLAKANTKRVC